MILTDEQMREVRQSIEAQAGLDAELMRRCGDLIHCVRAGIQPTNDKGWIPFRSPALVKYDRWDRPKPHRIPVFHLYPGKSGRGIAFGVQRYHSKVVGFDVSSLTEQLLALEFQIAGTRKDLRVSLRFHNDQEFFDALFDLVAQTAEELAETLEETE